MDDRFNTIAGWFLGGGIVLLGASLVAGEYFHVERPEHMGFPIEGVEAEGGAGGAAAEPPIAAALQTADVGRGQTVFQARCTSCHTINQGGANGTGPNLWGVPGEPIGQGQGGYAFSSALSGHGGTWDWENLSAWLRSPRTFANGTKMTFAGLADVQARADLILYMNSQGGTLTVPPPPAAGAPAGGEAGGNSAAPAGNSAAPAGNAAAPAAGNAAAPAAPAGNAAAPAAH